MTNSSTVAFNKDAFPIADAVGDSSFSLPIQALYSCVGVQAQYQAFVRLRSSEAAQLFIAIALDRTCVLEPSTGATLILTRVGFHPYHYGACTDVVPGT
jgi:hypothetical protein